MEEQVQATKKPTANVMRVLYSVLFWIVYRVSVCVILLIAIFQNIYATLKGEPHQKVLDFTDKLSKLSQEIVAYLGMNTDERPCIKNLFSKK
jgi:hypothetical protein